MNSASSASTGYAPFVLNNGRMPRSMLWNQDTEYPGVRRFVQNMKDVILSAHDSIISAQVKQTRLANSRRIEAPFSKGDLVYLSTANLSLPKGRAQKLSPKFIGPFRIIEEYKNNSFKLDLPAELRQRGVHPSFHVNLLRIHVPNDDRRFPGRQINQIISLGNSKEWAVDEILTHHGKGSDALFKLKWKMGDHAWFLYPEIADLEVVNQYLEAQGVSSVASLPKRLSNEEDLPLGAIDIALEILSLEIISDAMWYGQYGQLPKNGKEKNTVPYKKGSRVLKRHSRKFPRKSLHNMSTLAAEEDSLAPLYAFAEILRSRNYDPRVHHVPSGYPEWSVLMQGGEEEVPFAPGVHYVTEYQPGGGSLYVLASQTSRPQSNNQDRSDTSFDNRSRRERRNQDFQDRRNRRNKANDPRLAKAQRVMMERFELDTKTSKATSRPNGDNLPHTYVTTERAELSHRRHGRDDYSYRCSEGRHRCDSNYPPIQSTSTRRAPQSGPGGHIPGCPYSALPVASGSGSATAPSISDALSPIAVSDAGTYAGLSALYPEGLTSPAPNQNPGFNLGDSRAPAGNSSSGIPDAVTGD